MSDLPPILTQLPSTQTAFTRKYSNPQLQSALSSLPIPIRNALINFDLTRVQRGQQPLSSQQTLAALQSAITKQQATPQESGGLFSRALSDVQSIVSEVPRLPFTLYHEVTELPSAPGKLSEVLSRGGLDTIAGLSEVPGLRLVPGVFTVSNLARGGPGALLEHPVMSALDVLPYAKPAVSALTESTLSRLPSVQAARAGLDLESLNAAREAAHLPPASEPSALRLALRESPTAQGIAQSRPVQAIRSRFGIDTRDLMQTFNATYGKRMAQANPDAPPSIVTPDVQVFRDALTDARDWSQHIPAPRIQELTHQLELDRNTVLSDPNLLDTERAFVQSYIDHVDNMANYAITRDWLANVDGELFTPQEASRILSARRRTARYETLSDARNSVTSATPALDRATYLSEHLTRDDRIKLLTGYAHALDQSGIDASPLLQTIRDNRSATPEALYDTVMREAQSLTPSPILSQQDLIDRLTPFSRTDSSVARVLDHVRRGDYRSATTMFRTTLAQRTRHVIPESDVIFDSLSRHREAGKFLDSTRQFADARVEQARRIQSRIESRTIPARFRPLIEQHVKNKLFDFYWNDQPSLDLIERGFPHLIEGESPESIAKLYNEVASTWKQLRDQGYDPVFVHRVSPSRLGSVERLNIADSIRTPTQVRTRTGDATPYVQDAAVALTDQAMEYLSRLGQEEYTSNIVGLHGVSRSDLEQRYLDRGIRVAERNPQLNVRAHVERLIQRDYERYDPTGLFPESQAKLRQFGGDEIFIPKTVADVLRQQFHDHSYKLTAIFDPVMKVFRTSILPLSPRWHVGNIGGGAMLLTMSTDPFIFFRYFSRARELVRSDALHEVEGMPPVGFGSQPADIIEWNKRASVGDKLVAAWNFKGGQTLRRLWEESQGVRDKASAVVNWSYRFNGMIDDMYRAMAYLYGQDKALAKGLTAKEAEQAGVSLVRKILPEWDRMTPFERQIMRFAFPFYSWAQFIIRHAYRYPIDHPYRAAVTSSLARQDLEDFGTALPSRFMDAIFLGHPDVNGNVTALQLGSINPFRDVANYFTLAGFTRSANPIFTSVLESLGIDPSQGAQDLYPDIAYDPVTGQLRPSNPNLLSSFISNIIPQTELITALVGTNNRFKQILHTNPDAAAAMLRSSVGLPNLFRNVNPAQESFKAELRREDLQNQVRSEALRTGDLSRAKAFPQLRDYFNRLSTLMHSNPDLFKAYQVQANQANSVPNTLREVATGTVGL